MIQPKISIGLPVYNGEGFIHNAIRSILEQSYENFELIISDNASTDQTELICQNFVRLDKRIKYFRQNTNMGIVWNFNYVLQQANAEYFMWASADDVWHPEFIQRNLIALEKNQNLVGSISEVEFYYNQWQEKDFHRFRNTESAKKYQLVHPIRGNYEDKIRFVFDFSKSECTYAIYRTRYLKKCLIKRRFPSWEYLIILRILKYGDLHVEDGILMYKYMGGKTDSEYYRRLYTTMRMQNFGFLCCLFPFVPLTIWCAVILGPRIFYKHLWRFIKYNYRAERLVFFDIFSKGR